MYKSNAICRILVRTYFCRISSILYHQQPSQLILFVNGRINGSNLTEINVLVDYGRFLVEIVHGNEKVCPLDLALSRERERERERAKATENTINK